MVSLDEYYESTKGLLNGDAFNMSQLKADFEANFVKLEVDNSLISDKIGEWSKNLEIDAVKNGEKSELISLVLSILAITLSLFVPLYAWMAIFKPQSHIIDVMKVLAAGDSSVEINNQDRKDEIGEISRAVQVLKKMLLKKRSWKRREGFLK